MRRTLALGLLFTVAALTGAACSSSSSSSGAAGTSGTTTTGGGPQAIACTGEPAQLSLGGTWVASGRLAVTLQGAPGGAITICPANQVGEASLLLLITVEQDAAPSTKLRNIKATLCSIQLPVVTALVGACDPMSQSLVSTQIEIPKALLDALPKVDSAAVGGQLAGTMDGAGLTLDRFVVTAGSSKSGSSLAAWDDSRAGCDSPDLGRGSRCETTCVTDCPSMRDDDGDGYPGVTLAVCGSTASDVKKGVQCNTTKPSEAGVAVQGRAFMDLQVDPRFTGVAKSSCELTGTVDSHVDYHLVGADVDLEGAPIGVASAIKSLPTFAVDPAQSKFRMVRIDGKFGAPSWMADPTTPSAACAAILAHQNEL